MKTLKPLVFLAFVMLSGCATEYGPRQFAGGYSEVHIQNDVFRILVDGNAYIHKSQIEYYALVRAAELTAKQGRNYFRVIGANTDINTTNVFVPGQTFANSNTYGTGYSRATAYPVGRNVYSQRSRHIQRQHIYDRLLDAELFDNHAEAYSDAGHSDASASR